MRIEFNNGTGFYAEWKRSMTVRIYDAEGNLFDTLKVIGYNGIPLLWQVQQALANWRDRQQVIIGYRKPVEK